MWFFWLLAGVAVLFYLGQSPKKKRAAGHKVAPRKKLRRVVDAADLASLSPITTQAVACKALEQLLVSQGYGQMHKSVLRETLSDFREEMREHLEELQSSVVQYKEELVNERENESGMAEDVEDAETDSEGSANAARLARVREVVRGLEASLAQDGALLKQFRVDRTDFVVAYANHVLHGAPSPNRVKQKYFS